MARYGIRSKACANCRRVKKKCDEVYPQCGPCDTAHKTCPGPIKGNVFVNVDFASVHDNYIAKQSKTNATKPRNRQRKCDIIVLGASNSTELNETTPRPNVLRELHSVPLYEVQIISNLINFYSGSGRMQSSRSRIQQSWLVQLPDILHDTLSIRMRAPLLAPALVLLALQSRKQSALKEALEYYDRGLIYLRTRLSYLDSPVPDEKEDMFLICAALLMSFHETLHSTITGGYEQHVSGAVALLQVKGPELFAKPIYHDLFRAIRGHAIHISLVTGKPSCLCDEKWMSTPFSQFRKSNSEKINDILLAIPKYLAELRAEPLYNAGEIETHILKQDFIRKIDLLEDELDEISGHMLPMEVNPSCSDKYCTTNSITNDQNPEYRNSSHYTTAIQAKDIAMHACCKIILLHIMSSASQRCPAPSFCTFHLHNSNYDEGTLKHVEAYSTSILDVAKYLSQFDIGCAYVRMVLPLQLVGEVSPSPEQRESAKSILQLWWETTPIKGLTRSALESIESTAVSVLALQTL